jgi:hypothetical protein
MFFLDPKMVRPKDGLEGESQCQWDEWNKDETTCTYLESDTLQVMKRDLLLPSLFLSVTACSN